MYFVITKFLVIPVVLFRQPCNVLNFCTSNDGLSLVCVSWFPLLVLFYGNLKEMILINRTLFITWLDIPKVDFLLLLFILLPAMKTSVVSLQQININIEVL